LGQEYLNQNLDEALHWLPAGTLPLEKMITQVSPLKMQKRFETIDQTCGYEISLEIK
jgi:hypothetical protein